VGFPHRATQCPLPGDCERAKARKAGSPENSDRMGERGIRKSLVPDSEDCEQQSTLRSVALLLIHAATCRTSVKRKGRIRLGVFGALRSPATNPS